MKYVYSPIKDPGWGWVLHGYIYVFKNNVNIL